MKTGNFNSAVNDNHAFAEYLMVGYPHDRIASPEEFNWALQWFRRENLKHEDARTKDGWLRDLRALKLHAYGAVRLDRKRAERISHFIWAHEGEEPSFDKLLAWLKVEDAALEKIIHDRLKAARKKNKMQRKQRKLKRKRR